MKKQYMNPEMEVVELNMNVSLLAGSLNKNGEQVTNEGDILAPGLILDEE